VETTEDNITKKLLGIPEREFEISFQQLQEQ
jgi:hypothetical protein